MYNSNTPFRKNQTYSLICSGGDLRSQSFGSNRGRRRVSETTRRWGEGEELKLLYHAWPTIKYLMPDNKRKELVLALSAILKIYLLLLLVPPKLKTSVDFVQILTRLKT